MKRNKIDQVERICISVNSYCNYACRYCYFFNSGNSGVKQSSLKATEILEILDNVYNYHWDNNFEKKIKINFVGSGEPLLSWESIYQAVSIFWRKHPNQRSIKFYTVTNGSLITPEIAKEMKLHKIFPSISLDGPPEINNKYRIFPNGAGTFNDTMKGINILRKVGFDIVINTTLSRNLLNNLDIYFSFVKEAGISKIIFDRMVDVPKNVETVTYDEYYKFLQDVNKFKKLLHIDKLEIGNLEAYRRTLIGKPDQVCTMFGSSCGAGTHFIIYMGRKVYPCGRMFGQDKWLLGDYRDDISILQSRMYKHIKENKNCLKCSAYNECIRDCILDSKDEKYRCESRLEFLNKIKLEGIS